MPLSLMLRRSAHRITGCRNPHSFESSVIKSSVSFD
jgi:hypothetical protein